MIFDLPSIYNPGWRPAACNCDTIGATTTVDASPSFIPSDERYLYCPSWVEKSAQVSPHHHNLEAGSEEIPNGTSSLSEDLSDLDITNYPSKQLTAQEIDQQTLGPMLSDSFLFSWP